MRIITIRYTDDYEYEKPLLFTTPDLTNNQIAQRLQQAVLKKKKKKGYNSFQDGDYDGNVFGSLLPEVPLRILERYGIGIIYADVLTADYDYVFSPLNWIF